MYKRVYFVENSEHEITQHLESGKTTQPSSKPRSNYQKSKTKNR